MLHKLSQLSISQRKKVGIIIFVSALLLAPIYVWAVNPNPSYQLPANTSGFPIKPRQSDNTTLASTPVCVSNTSTVSYFIPNNTSAEVTNFIGAVEGSQLPGVSYLKMHLEGTGASTHPVWAWTGSGAPLSPVCLDGICNSSTGETYANDPSECCASYSCSGKVCGDNGCGGDCALSYRNTVGYTNVTDSSGYILYAWSNGTYYFTLNGTPPPTAYQHNYCCVNGQFSGDGSPYTTCSTGGTSTPTPTYSCHGPEALCAQVTTETGCNNLSSYNTHDAYHCYWGAN